MVSIYANRAIVILNLTYQQQQYQRLFFVKKKRLNTFDSVNELDDMHFGYAVAAKACVSLELFNFMS